MSNLAADKVLRVNSPGWGVSSTLPLGEAKPLAMYDVIVINPCSIVHLFEPKSDLAKEIEDLIADDVYSLKMDNDSTLESISAELELREHELRQFISKGGLLVYFLNPTFKLSGPSMSMDNYLWLYESAPDVLDGNSRTTAAVKSKDIELTSKGKGHVFAPYLKQLGLEARAAVRKDDMNEGYKCLAENGSGKSLSAYKSTGPKRGQVLYLPAPYDTRYDDVLKECMQGWYELHTGPDADKPESELDEEAPAKSKASVSSAPAKSSADSLFDDLFKDDEDEEDEEDEDEDDSDMDSLDELFGTKKSAVDPAADNSKLFEDEKAMGDAVDRAFDELVPGADKKVPAEMSRKKAEDVDDLFADKKSDKSFDDEPAPKAEKKGASIDWPELDNDIPPFAKEREKEKERERERERAKEEEKSRKSDRDDERAREKEKDKDREREEERARKKREEDREEEEEREREEERARKKREELRAREREEEEEREREEERARKKREEEREEERTRKKREEERAREREEEEEREREEERARKKREREEAREREDREEELARKKREEERERQREEEREKEREKARQRDEEEREEAKAREKEREKRREEEEREREKEREREREEERAREREREEKERERQKEEDRIREREEERDREKKREEDRQKERAREMQRELDRAREDEAERQRARQEARERGGSYEAKDLMSRLEQEISSPGVPDWCQKVSIAELRDLHEELSDLDQQVRKARQKMADVEDRIRSLGELKDSLISLSGVRLTQACCRVFESLGWTVQVSETSAGELWLSDGDKMQAIVRIVHSTSHPNRSELAELAESVITYWGKYDVEPKGILVASTYADRAPKERMDEEDFPGSMGDFAKRKNLCLFTCLQLLSIYRDVAVKSNDSRKVRENLLTTSGILPGYKLDVVEAKSSAEATAK